jgi:hypothetical protein
MNTQVLLTQSARQAAVDRVFSLLEDIEYRRVLTAEDLDAVARVRRAAYADAEVYANPDQPVVDDYDLDPRVYVFGVHWRERLVATMRIHILSQQNRKSNSLSYFPDVLEPLIDQGMTFMDPTRFAVDPRFEQAVPGLATVVLRLGLAAVRHFNCDFGLAMIKEGHGGFYRKVFNYTQMTPFQKFATFNPRYALYSTSRSHADDVCRNQPVLDGLALESRLLFASPKHGEPAVLSVRPTAKLALRNRFTFADPVAASV